MSTTQTLPRWDMSVVYPSLDSPEFDQGFAHFTQQVADLVQLFNTHAIQAQSVQKLSEATIQTFEAVTTRLNEVLEEATTLGAYLSCFVTTNTQDTLAQARYSEFQQQAVKLSLLGTRYDAWIGSLDIPDLVKRSPLAKEHAYMLQKSSEQARP